MKLKFFIIVLSLGFNVYAAVNAVAVGTCAPKVEGINLGPGVFIGNGVVIGGKPVDPTVKYVPYFQPIGTFPTSPSESGAFSPQCVAAMTAACTPNIGVIQRCLAMDGDADEFPANEFVPREDIEPHLPKGTFRFDRDFLPDMSPVAKPTPKNVQPAIYTIALDFILNHRKELSLGLMLTIAGMLAVYFSSSAIAAFLTSGGSLFFEGPKALLLGTALVAVISSYGHEIPGYSGEEKASVEVIHETDAYQTIEITLKGKTETMVLNKKEAQQLLESIQENKVDQTYMD